MPSKKLREIKDLLILRSTCLYQYAAGIKKYTKALRKIKELETELLSLSQRFHGKGAISLSFNNGCFLPA